MYTSSTFFLALITSSLVSAFPGKYGYNSSAPPAYGLPSQTICSTELVTTTTSGTSATVEETTTTIYVPVTQTAEVTSMIVQDVLVTAVDYSTQEVVETAMATVTQTVPVTTFSLVVDTTPCVSTRYSTIPVTAVTTGQTTMFTQIPSAFVTSVASTSVCSITDYIPFTSTVVSTQTGCTTLNAFGW